MPGFWAMSKIAIPFQVLHRRLDNPYRTSWSSWHGGCFSPADIIWRRYGSRRLRYSSSSFRVRQLCLRLDYLLGSCARNSPLHPFHILYIIHMHICRCSNLEPLDPGASSPPRATAALYIAFCRHPSPLCVISRYHTGPSHSPWSPDGLHTIGYCRRWWCSSC